ncbi:MAG: glycosyltransferase family 4 protein [Candidatus Fermentibacteraceae bacterium]|nr:glycosyltransferase family 4 protein [Candidatus Fermentibacteraceae bacterium]
MFHNLPSGGGIRVLSDMLDRLQDHFHVTVHYPEGSQPLGSGRTASSREWPFPGGRRLKGLRRAAAPLVLAARLRAFDRLCRQISMEMNRNSRLALVHNSMLVAAPPLLRYLSVPSVYFCYEYPRHIYEPSLVRRTDSGVQHLLLSGLRRREKRMDFNAARSAGRMITLSSWMARRLHDIYGASPLIVRPGVDTGVFRPDGKAGQTNMVLSVGALWPFKGHETALESLALMPEEVRPGLTVVADREYPGYARRLRTAASDLGVDLEIRKGISDLQLRDLYNRAGAVLCCQMNEPYGLVPLEAMSCGTPVVAVEEGGFTDSVLSGENGILVRRDPRQIASALERVLTDRELAGNLGKRGRRFVTTERTREAAAESLAEILLGML